MRVVNKFKVYLPSFDWDLIYIGLIFSILFIYLSSIEELKVLMSFLNSSSQLFLILTSVIVVSKLLWKKDQRLTLSLRKSFEKPLRPIIYVTIPTLLIIGIYLFDIISINDSSFHFLWFFGGGCCIIIGGLISSFVINKWESHVFFHVIIPSKQFIMTRILLSVMLITSFSPVFLFLSNYSMNDVFLRDSIGNLIFNSITISFGFWFLYMLGIIIKSRFFRKIHTNKFEEIRKGIFFTSFCILILMVLLVVIGEIEPNIFYWNLPGDRFQPWGYYFCLFVVNNLNFMVIAYPYTISQIEKLSLSSIKPSSISTRILYFVLFLYIPLFFVFLVDFTSPLYLTSFIFLETVYLLTMLWILNNIRLNLDKIPVLKAISYFFLGSSIIGPLLKTDTFSYEIVLSESLGIIVFPLFLLFLNYLLLNYLFLKFDFSSFLDQEINMLEKPLTKIESIKILSIESINFIPLSE